MESLAIEQIMKKCKISKKLSKLLIKICKDNNVNEEEIINEICFCMSKK